MGIVESTLLSIGGICNIFGITLLFFSLLDEWGSFPQPAC